MRKFLLFITVLLFWAGNTQAQSVAELIAQGDAHSLKEFNNEKALAKFLQADKLSPNNYEILWRLSRSCADIADRMPSSTDEQIEAQKSKYQEALDYANRAVAAGQDKSITYLRRAIARGKMALLSSWWKKGGVVNSVKEDVDKALQLGNGGNEVLATAHYVLARTHAKVCEKPKLLRLPAGLGWGNIDEALKHYQIAVDMRPNYRMFRLDYARTLIDEDQYQKAKDQLYKIPYIAVQHQDDEKVAIEAKQLLEEIKNK